MSLNINVGCSKCECGITKKEYNYSIEHHGQALCRDCQQKYAYYAKHTEKVKEKASPQAIKLCDALKKMGYDARLEQWDGHKHIDIAIPNLKINIEIDGMQHVYDKKQALADLKRTYHSFKKHYMTFRIPNKLIDESAYKTAGYLKKILDASEEQLEEEDESFF